MFKEFKEFAIKGNVVDMAIGIIIGAAFTAVVKSVVDDVLMGPLGMLTGGLDFTDQFFVLKDGPTAGPYPTLEAARAAGAVVVAWGMLINNIISFLIVAFVLFLVVRWINRLRRTEEAPPAPPSTRACPYCTSDISIKASRCPCCTSEVTPASPAEA